jgi:hypothetical protein
MLQWKTYRAGTGIVEHPFDFACSRCGHHAPAVVRNGAEGTATSLFGVGGDAELATRRAQNAARAHAVRAFACAACPRCRTLQPTILKRFQALTRAEARRSRLRLPAALVATLFTAFLLGLPALLDLKNSSALMWMAIGLAVLAGASVYCVLAWPLPPPRFLQGDVWMAQAALGGGQEWVKVPPPRFDPRGPQPSRWPALASLVFATSASALAMFSLHVFMNSYQTVYVADSLRNGDLRVRVDGRDRGRLSGVLSSVTSKDDVEFLDFSVRKGRSHTIELLDGHGAPLGTYTLDGNKLQSAWVLAPSGVQNDLCVAEVQEVYGAQGDRAPVSVLNRAGDLTALRRAHYREVLHTPPSEVSGKQKNGVRHWTVRAVSCRALHDGRLIPFRSQPKFGADSLVTAANL